MTPPRLAPLHTVPAKLRPALARGARLFVVERAGAYAGRRFEEGDVLVVGGAPVDGAMSVLVTEGLGRPRLGRVAGGRLLGDADEPCAPSRWRLAGAVLDVRRPAPRPQLALFAQAA